MRDKSVSKHFKSARVLLTAGTSEGIDPRTNPDILEAAIH
jgi:hypothetical protein